MKLYSWLALVLLVVGSAQAQKTINPAFTKKIEATIDHTIPVITATQLHKKINTPNLVILDAREANEYNTSHIKNAQQVGYDNFKLKNVEGVDKNATIVIYCSIGYRSEKVGEQLKKNGYSKVYNLYGGIFEWVNAGNAVVNKWQQPTSKVHVYSQEWGKWLQRGKKVY